FIDYTVPLSVGPDSKTVEPRGWNIPEGLTLERASPEPFESFLTVFHPRVANSFRVRTEKHMTVTGDGPFTPPFSVTRVLGKANDESTVRFTGKKGQALAIQVESRSFGLAMDPVVRILDKDKKQLARAEPPKLSSDTALSFT